MITTLALDLEGTLISNAVSQFPRHGLLPFLEWCHASFQRVVVFSAVRPALIRSIVEDLSARGDAPGWFATVEIVEWTGKKKNLSFINGCCPKEALIVDDQEVYIVDEQKSQWIPIREFSRPFTAPDDDLQKTKMAIIAAMGRQDA